jgi:DNA-binding transcriptional MerR regulator
MGILEQVIQMRNQGMPDQEIISQLQEQGMSPKIINDALNQANIKTAVGTGIEEMSPIQYGDDLTPVQQVSGQYSPSSKEYAEDIYVPQVQTQQRQYAYPENPQKEYVYQEAYQGEQYNGADADMMVEISQQVFAEKIKKIHQQIEDLNEFRTIYQTKVDGIFERLKKIEGVIDRLQSAILEKVGSYGAGIEGVKKELSMVQDTYGKILDAVSEKHHASHHHPHETHYGQKNKVLHKASASSKSRKKKH